MKRCLDVFIPRPIELLIRKFLKRRPVRHSGVVDEDVHLRSLAERLQGRESKVHILVNNAGVTHGAPLEEVLDEEVDRAWNVNVKATFHLTRALLPQLRASASVEDPGRVINVSSVNGSVVPELAGHKGSAPVRESWGYAASKAGVNML